MTWLTVPEFNWVNYILFDTLSKLRKSFLSYLKRLSPAMIGSCCSRMGPHPPNQLLQLLVLDGANKCLPGSEQPVGTITLQSAFNVSRIGYTFTPACMFLDQFCWLDHFANLWERLLLHLRKCVDPMNPATDDLRQNIIPSFLSMFII